MGRFRMAAGRFRMAAGLFAAILALAAQGAAPAWSASKPAKNAPPQQAPQPVPPQQAPQPVPPQQAPVAPEIKANSEALRYFLGGSAIRTPQDSIGNGEYFAARRLFEAGRFDSSTVEFREFAERYPRNLRVNEAIEHILLTRQNREPGDEALKVYAQTLALRDAGLADSAAATARTALARYPNAKIRYHFQYFLAETARDKGDHATAIQYALLVADSTSKSRLAPYALRLVGDETIAMGQDPAKALRVFQALLERYPDSPLAPPVRAQVIAIRKKLQL